MSGRMMVHARHRSAGFTFVELLVSLSLFAAVSVIVLQGFVAAMGHAGRSNEKVAATALAVQIMEQIHASVNPYTMVNIGDLPRSPLPLPAPYAGAVNPAPYPFEVAVDVTQDGNLTVITALVDVYRPGDPAPLVSMMTMLDDQ